MQTWRASVHGLVGLAVLALAARAQQPRTTRLPEVFEILPFHSQIEFSVPFMGLSTVKGRFEDFSGALLLDTERPSNSSVTLWIGAASLRSGNDLRDRHLKSSDFFDVERFPAIWFRSDQVASDPRGGSVMRGVLTMHGVERPIIIPFTERHPLVRDRGGVDYAGYDATVKLNWREFGIAATNTHNGWFNPSEMLVNDSVTVTLSIDAVRIVRTVVSNRHVQQSLAVVGTEGVEGLRALLTRIKATAPDSASRLARALPTAGVVLLQKGQAEKSAEVLELAVEVLPRDVQARVNLAATYLAQGRQAAAAEAYRTALAMDADTPIAVEMLRRLRP